MSDYTAVLKRATQDPEFRRKAIAILTKKAWKEVPVSEFPAPQKHIADMLLRRGLNLETSGWGHGGYTLDFGRGSLNKRTLGVLMMSQALRWIAMDWASAKKYFPGMGEIVGAGKSRFTKDEIAPLVDTIPQISWINLTIGC